MKQIKNYCLFFLSTSLLFFSCNGQNKNTVSADSKAGNTVASNTSSSGDASFSCKIDGKEFSGKGTDQNINAAFHLTGDDKGQIFFRLSDMNNIGDKFQFQVAAKEGPTTFMVTPTSSYLGYITNGVVNYLDDPITITVTSLTAARVAGTFSGTYTLSQGSADSKAKQTIQITDGKFDIPFSTSAEWKQLYHAE